MRHKLLKRHVFIVGLLLLTLTHIAPVQAGDPDDTVGPANPNRLVCVDQNNHLIVPTDSDAFDGTTILTFDPEIEVNVKQLEEECKAKEDYYGADAHFAVEHLRQTRIEGYVFEFHPEVNSPGGWMAVRSRDVPVVASGPGFQVEWGSEKDGLYFFDNFGEGPITLNLRLPPDAHPINPNIVVVSTGFYESWDIDLGFYRGDTPPEDIDALRLPDDHSRSTLLPADTILEVDEEGKISIMPNVGDILPLSQPISTIVLAVAVLIILPTAGFLKLRYKHSKD